MPFYEAQMALQVRGICLYLIADQRYIAFYDIRYAELRNWTVATDTLKCLLNVQHYRTSLSKPANLWRSWNGLIEWFIWVINKRKISLSFYNWEFSGYMEVNTTKIVGGIWQQNYYSLEIYYEYASHNILIVRYSAFPYPFLLCLHPTQNPNFNFWPSAS